MMMRYPKRTPWSRRSSLGRRSVRHVNSAYRRSGTLWEGRYRAAPIDSEACFLAAATLSSSTPCALGWSITRAG
jgi:hypothetical protein